MVRSSARIARSKKLPLTDITMTITISCANISLILSMPTTSVRRALTAKLFIGSYRNTIDEINVVLVLFAIARRILR